MRWLVLAVALSLSVAPTKASAFEATFLAASEVELANPHDVKLAPDGTRLFVSDEVNDRVVILDAESLALLGHFGAEELNSPHDLDFGPEGRLYVADKGNDRIAIYEIEGQTGKLVDELTRGLRDQEGVLVGRDGRIFATGIGVGKLAEGTGRYLQYKDGVVEGALSQMSAPHGMAFAPNGDIWLAEGGVDLILRTPQDPRTISRISINGAPYNFDTPRHLAVAPDGTLVVADKYNHSIKVIAEDGRLLGVVGNGKPGKGAQVFRTPEGIELSGDITWIVDAGNDRIVKYRITWD